MRIILNAAAAFLFLGLALPTYGDASVSPSTDDGRLPPVPQSEAQGASRRLSLNEFRAYNDERHALVLDARPQATYKAGHVPGALLLSSLDFEKDYSALRARLEADKNQLIVVYCAGIFCHASQTVQKQLVARGYTQVFVFPKGWAGWTVADLPEEKSE